MIWCIQGPPSNDAAHGMLCVIEMESIMVSLVRDNLYLQKHYAVSVGTFGMPRTLLDDAASNNLRHSFTPIKYWRLICGRINLRHVQELGAGSSVVFSGQRMSWPGDVLTIARANHAVSSGLSATATP